MGRKSGESNSRRDKEDLLQKMVSPVRRVWVAVSGRAKPSKDGAALLNLQGDIQSCGYSDVQVMWELLGGTESELTSRHIKNKTPTIV
ncbi:hypothetical protein RND71_006182 [Anisodus tanguticus]|uniref:Uncharacterized protein n=1 Tax=Anisodus tanguticus TaxID=243964 RepID=A0AAE1VW04_9SOLA|nr:hypothetical protein RND71_006182 [Anisodus tanguticus]